MPFIHAEAASFDAAAVVYTSGDGMRVVRKGGTRTWRNNNPGNLRYTAFSRSHGAIGTAGRFAVFPTVEVGRSAITTLLQGPRYAPLSIANAISRYAPPTENDTKNYERLIAKLTGLDITRKLAELNPEELAAVVSAIQTIEGYKIGTEIAVKIVTSAVSKNGRLTEFQIQGGSTYISLSEAIELARSGQIDAVVVRMTNGQEYLRAKPDKTDSNNFSSLADQPSET